MAIESVVSAGFIGPLWCSAEYEEKGRGFKS
jgi:hypothetical protein